MTSKRAKKNYRMKALPSRDEPEHSHMMDEDEMQRMADGGIAEMLKNRGKVIDAAEAKAVTPTPTPVKPMPAPTPPTQVPIIPGLADQMAARQAARLKAEAEAALAVLPPRKKFLGLFADGGPVGMRGYASGGEVWGGMYKDKSRFTVPYSDPNVITPSYGGPQAQSRQGPQFSVADLATTGPSTSPSYDASSLQTLGIRSGPQPKNSLDNSQPGYKFDRSTMMFDPKAGGPAPLVSDSMPGATGSVMADSQWNTLSDPKKSNINPKTGYPMMADGGPVTDNESTARFAKKYDGPGGVRDIPAFANGGLTIPNGGMAVMTQRGTGRKIILDRGGMHGATPKGMTRYTGAQYKAKMGWADGGSVPPVTRARAVADDIESQRMSPALNKVGPNSAFTVPALALDAARAKALGRKERTSEEMDELTREVGRGVRGMADGGGVDDGRVYGEGGPTEDKVKIRVSPGEFVLPADTVKAVGAGGLRRLIAETHTPVKGGPGMNKGGGVWDWLNTWGTRAKAATAAGADAWAEAEKNATTAAPKTSGREPGWRSEAGSGTGVPRGTPPPGTPVGMGGSPAPGLLDKARAAQTGWAGGKPINFSLPLEKATELTKWGARNLAVPAALASTFDDVKGTDTDEYRKRFALDNPEGAAFGTKWLSTPSLPSDLIVRGLGAASDLGRVAGKVTDFFGLGNPMDSFYRDKAEAGAKPPTPGLRSTSTVDPSKTEGFGMGDRGAGVNTLAPNPKKTSFSNADIAPAPAAGPEGPSIADTNAAARAEMQAMDARKAAAGVVEGRRLDDMNLRGQQAGAAWDRQVAIGRKDPQMYANAVRNEELLKEGSNRTLARDLKGMEETGQTNRANAIAGASRYGSELGLRGQMIGAQATLMGHLMNNQLTIAQLRHTVNKENAKDLHDEISTRAQVFMPGKEGGPPVLDPAATAKNVANLKRFFLDPTANDLAMIRSIMPGANSIKDIPKEHFGTLIDKALTNVSIGAATGGQGMPESYTTRERGLADAFAGRGRNSQVGFGSTLLNNFNMFAPPERNRTLTTQTPGSLPMDSVLEDVLAGDRGKIESVMHALSQSSNPEDKQAAEALSKRLGIR